MRLYVCVCVFLSLKSLISILTFAIPTKYFNNY